MIISHTHKFIFIKSFKTAGTSVEAALSNYCSGSDIVTPLNDYRHNRDENGKFIHKSMNAEEYIQLDLPNLQHVEALTIKDRVSPEVWNTYFKVSIARNPWDRAVSYFFWEMRNDPALKPQKKFYHYLGVPFNELDQLRQLFSTYIRNATWPNNDCFYTIDDQLCTDFVIRYETLPEDYSKVCEKLGLPASTLPRLKGGIRKQRYHYSDYYNEESIAIVSERHKNDIRLFGYEFERT
jgi:hypothetical protein